MTLSFRSSSLTGCRCGSGGRCQGRAIEDSAPGVHAAPQAVRWELRGAMAPDPRPAHSRSACWLSRRRFAFDFNLMRRIKLSDRFFLQPRMRASEFLRPEVAVDGDSGEQSGEAVADQEYELFAIMIHQGTARGGHYFAYIKVALLPCLLAAAPRCRAHVLLLWLCPVLHGLCVARSRVVATTGSSSMTST